MLTPPYLKIVSPYDGVGVAVEMIYDFLGKGTAVIGVPNACRDNVIHVHRYLKKKLFYSANLSSSVLSMKSMNHLIVNSPAVSLAIETRGSS